MEPNAITKLFEDISDDELISAIAEIKEADETGIIKIDGVVRKYARASSDIAKTGMATMLLMAQINLLKQAAYRWHSQQ